MATNEVPGYEHPDSAAPVSRGQIYKTFNSESKPRKKEVFGSTEAIGRYVQVGRVDDDTKCPQCDETFVTQCNCVFSEKTCSAGHIWYIDRDGATVQGNPHKK